MVNRLGDAVIASSAEPDGSLTSGREQANKEDSQELAVLLSPLRNDEVEILWDLLSNLPLKAIATKRNISRRTVQFRKRRLLDRFGCRSLLDLAALFAARGVSFSGFESDFFSRYRFVRRESGR
jgi:DNA-binding NarL/FixJ family response regulator